MQGGETAIVDNIWCPFLVVTCQIAFCRLRQNGEVRWHVVGELLEKTGFRGGCDL